MRIYNYERLRELNPQSFAHIEIVNKPAVAVLKCTCSNTCQSHPYQFSTTDILEIMSKRHLLLLSNSTLHPTGYLEYAKDHIIQFLKSHNVSKVSFFKSCLCYFNIAFLLIYFFRFYLCPLLLEIKMIMLQKQELHSQLGALNLIAFI